MPDENRVPLFVRVLPSVKDEAAEAAWRERVSVSRYVEEAIRERVRRGKEPAAAD